MPIESPIETAKKIVDSFSNEKILNRLKKIDV